MSPIGGGFVVNVFADKLRPHREAAPGKGSHLADGEDGQLIACKTKAGSDGGSVEVI